MIEDWLAGRRLKLNNKWQLYPTAKRTVAALGYRFGHKFSLLRKRNMVRLKKSLSEDVYKRQVWDCGRRAGA